MMPKEQTGFHPLRKPCRDLDASRDLYEILGLVRSSDVAHISTKRDLPVDASPEVTARAEAIGEDDEGAWRHVHAERVLEFPHWNDVVEVTYVHGPRDHVAWRERREVCRSTPHEDWKRRGLSGWREVSPEEMDKLVEARPELLADPHQAIGKIYTLAREGMSVAERLGFADVLAWLRQLEPTRRTRLVIYFEIYLCGVAALIVLAVRERTARSRVQRRRQAARARHVDVKA